MNEFKTNQTPAARLQALSDPSTQAESASDMDLISLYVDAGDRQAIETLIRRYAPLVASVCRLTVADPASAEDAFQATFLILLKSARKIRQRDSVAAWLHGVAYRTASRIRKQARKMPMALSPEGNENVIAIDKGTEDPVTQLARSMDLEVLDRELEHLPDRLREPLVEHYLLGHTAPEIARRMELSTSAVEGRLKRGRRRLRSRLAQRGISLSVLVAGSCYFQEHLKAAEANDWTNSFADTFLQPEASGEAGDGSGLPNSDISSLVNGELTMLNVTVLKTVAAACLCCAVGSVFVLASDPFPMGGSGFSDGRAPARQSNTTVINEMPLPQANARIQSVLGQAGDPFGSSTPQDPTAAARATSSSSNDPFSADSSDDPFGAGSADPFGSGGLGAPPSSRGTVSVMPKATGPNQASAIQNPLAADSVVQDSDSASDPDSISTPPTWRRPQDSDGATPVWLSGGAATMQSVEQTRASLATNVNFEFIDVPLHEAIAMLADDVGVQMEVNLVELEMLGIDRDTPITAVGSGTVRELFRRILTPLDLGYRVNESTIEVTSIDHVDSEPSMRFYDLSYVLPNASNAEALTNAIQQSINPDLWLVNGGTGTIALVGSMMIVTAPEPSHHQIEVLLMNLTRVNPSNMEAPVPYSGAAIMDGGPGGGAFGGSGMGGGLGGGGGMF